MFKLTMALFIVLGAMFAMCKNSSVTTTELGENYRLVFYNVENLFDIRDDAGKNDADFLPESKIRWNSGLYEKKLNNITKVIQALGENPDDLPELIALSEVENRSVLEDLIDSLGQQGQYGIVHRDSPDERGIDVAMIYDKGSVKIKNEQFHRVPLPGGDQTREILQVEAELNNESVHIFVNHWSSNYPSKKESEHKRLSAAKTLKTAIDEINSKNPDAKIVVVGDFNDRPSDKSITEVLEAGMVGNTTSSMYNLSAHWPKKTAGTIYRSSEEQWMIIDQIIVSQAFIDGKGIKTGVDQAQIFNPDWITYRRNNGVRVPSRFVNTYTGKVYGGYSDHFPVYLDLK